LAPDERGNLHATREWDEHASRGRPFACNQGGGNGGSSAFHLRVPDFTLARSEIVEIEIEEIRGARFGDRGQHLWGEARGAPC
jgi:hypothetical protein